MDDFYSVLDSWAKTHKLPRAALDSLKTLVDESFFRAEVRYSISPEIREKISDPLLQDQVFRSIALQMGIELIKKFPPSLVSGNRDLYFSTVLWVKRSYRQIKKNHLKLVKD